MRIPQLLQIPKILQLCTLALGFHQAGAAVGGGFLNGGLDGEYFANSNLTSPASFERRDVRLDFDWGTAKPGGSISPSYAAVGSDNYSVRWTGQVSSRFAETYTFKAVVADGVVLKIKPQAGSTYTTLINQWNASGTFTANYAMSAGGYLRHRCGVP